MSAKIDAALKNPPRGVQVWSSCVADQRSFETEDAPIGAFDGRLVRVCAGRHSGSDSEADRRPPAGAARGLGRSEHEEGTRAAQAGADAATLRQRAGGGCGLQQGRAPPDPPVLASVPVSTGDVAKIRRTIEGVLDEIGVPPVKPGRDDTGLKFELLPPFSEKALEKYAPDKQTNRSCARAVAQARAVLWAVNVYNAPAAIADDVSKVKGALRGVNLAVLKDGYRYNQMENTLKTRSTTTSARSPRYSASSTRSTRSSSMRRRTATRKPRRWQANFDFMVARVEAQIAFIYEYQSMLGLMRKELPPRDAKVHNGWRLAAQPRLAGDAKGKKMAQNSVKTLEKLIKDHAGTPWEVLAKRREAHRPRPGMAADPVKPREHPVLGLRKSVVLVCHAFAARKSLDGFGLRDWAAKACHPAVPASQPTNSEPEH